MLKMHRSIPPAHFKAAQMADKTAYSLAVGAQTRIDMRNNESSGRAPNSKSLAKLQSRGEPQQFQLRGEKIGPRCATVRKKQKNALCCSQMAWVASIGRHERTHVELRRHLVSPTDLEGAAIPSAVWGTHTHTHTHHRRVDR